MASDLEKSDPASNGMPERPDYSPAGQWKAFRAGLLGSVRDAVASGTSGRFTGRMAGTFAAFSALCIACLLTVMFISVAFRYGLNTPIAISEELTAFFLGLTIFSAFPFVTMEKSHIQIELLIGLVRGRPKLERLRQFLVDLGTLAMVVFLGTRLWEQATRYMERLVVSEGQEWPLAPIVFVFVGLLAIAAWVFALVILADLRRPRREDRDAGTS